MAWAAWQTAFGLGPADGERLQGALLKHVREAGLHTAWTEQDPAYEEAVAAFVAAGPCGAPGEHVAALRSVLEPYIRANVLGAALVHLTMPGVPDLYQGTESEYRALVDPDNRRPVRFPPGGPGEKDELTATALRLRARRPAVFGDTATYTPLAAEGPAAAHCVAFARSGEVVTAVTRLSLRLADTGGWQRHAAAAAAGPVGRSARSGAGVHRARARGGAFRAGCRWRCWSGSARSENEARVRAGRE